MLPNSAKRGLGLTKTGGSEYVASPGNAEPQLICVGIFYKSSHFQKHERYIEHNPAELGLGVPGSKIAKPL
jgi:hypothetical protein